MNVRNWLTIALSGALMAIVIFAGCDTGGGGIVGPVPDNKSYGPPMYQIAFIDTDGSIGTVTEGTSTPHYYRNSGNGKEMGAVDFTALWYTGNNVGDQYHILASTKSTDGVSSANVITEAGIVTLVEEDIFPVWLPSPEVERHVWDSSAKVQIHTSWSGKRLIWMKR